ncbi:7-cyano-7-deazaguanine synthase [Caballeronia sp. ATUFL_M1_KS5A]|uniref:7-cyano-7-deazaguanine synthase n=1 Tax=Caballeronia sp. ATUFL_M1_KS5A TaxID=2921778 RepID=UPI0020289C19|nr:7-cyano-7-deazaguanine synthase [Caballeronia sp. ATUFL_M1_KS5A]
MRKKKCLIVLSGGLDSATTAYKLAAEGYSLRSAYFDYGKPISTKEKSAAKLIALRLSIPLEIVDVSGLMQMEIGYLPWERVKTDDADGAKPTDHLMEISDKAKTYLASIPAGANNWFKTSGFHTLVSLSTYLAQITGFNSIALGITKEQFVSSPSLAAFLQSWGPLIKTLNPDSGEFEVLTPLAESIKAQIVKIASDLGCPLETTWSCSNDQQEYHCGTCLRCRERRAAFQSAGIQDPTRYATEGGTVA